MVLESPKPAQIRQEQAHMDVETIGVGSRTRDRRTSAYWPEIDGLRAIAVLAVFFYHFDGRLLGSGFIGVDIFFVISGFLISTILLIEIDEGHFSIPGFYQRRIARIAPAFFFVLFTTLGVGELVYSAQDFGSLGANSLAAALSATNIKLLHQGGYFISSPDAQPILHYWSLSVEEQFYLVFPLCLYLLMRFSRRPLVVTVVVGLLSFAACVALTQRNSVYAFYLLPTRAWELLAGFSVALIQRQTEDPGLRSRRVSISGWGGLALLGISFIFIRESARFPGWIAALPVIGTALIIASVGSGDWFPNRLLSHPLPVYIGKRSYSLYLWHWPVFSFVDYQFYSSGSALRVALKILISIAATLLTYRLIERPMRAYLNSRQRRQVAFGGFALAVIVVCALGWVIRSNQYLDANPAQIASGGISTTESGRQSVVLFGDSQGSMYARDVAFLSHVDGFSLNILSAAGRNELPGEPDTLWPDVRQFLAARRPHVIILAYAWSSKLGKDAAHLREALAYMEPLGSRVILINQPPTLPPLATRAAIRAGVRPPFFEEPSERADRLRASATVRSLSDNRITVLDPAPIFLEHGLEIRLIARNGRLTYHDADHLSDSGTALVRPMLNTALIAALSR
jgi:peptidoglycan/LPS O-acetylase OafA/YrhL